MQKHTDNRRTLIEWIEDAPVRSCKVIVAKGECIVGNHYHLKKDEWFYLLVGSCQYQLGDEPFRHMTDVVYAPRGLKHTFKLTDNSVLLSAASEPFDKDDEIQ